MDSKMRSHQARQGGNQTVQITAQQFGAKFQSKTAVHYFLTVDVGAYLPPECCLTMYFMRDLVMGKRKYLKSESVRYLTCPMYEGLSQQDFLEKAKASPAALQYLPEERDQYKLPRQFCVNIIFTVLGQEIAEWVSTIVEARNLKIAQDRKMLLELDPEIASAFNKSTQVAISRGQGYQLLKPGTKRKRSSAEVAMARNKEELQRELDQETEQRIRRLEDELQKAQREAESHKNAADILTGFINNGEAVVDQNGEVRIVQSDVLDQILGPNIIGNSQIDE